MSESSEKGKFNKWDYNARFREYLLLLSTKKEIGLEFKKNYPAQIELSPRWHKLFGKVRTSTLENGKEHWGFIGYKEDHRSLWFTSTPAEGYDSYVPGELIRNETNKARDKFGIVDLVGDVHSHPRGFLERVDQNFLTFNASGLKAAFSAGDLYLLANTEEFRPMMAVVEGDYNLLVFRTRETKGLGMSSILFDQDSFEKFWYEKYGFKYLGNVKKYGAYRVKALTDTANIFDVNIGIAERHNLVIYQGKKGEDVKRIFPKV